MIIIMIINFSKICVSLSACVCVRVWVCALIYYAGKSKALSSLYLPHYSLSSLTLSLFFSVSPAANESPHLLWTKPHTTAPVISPTSSAAHATPTIHSDHAHDEHALTISRPPRAAGRHERQAEEEVDRCRLFVEGDPTKNELYSPEYPNLYPKNINCTRVITGECDVRKVIH